MVELEKSFPPGLKWSIPYDTTRFVRVSIIEVLITLAEAMALVFIVVFAFLQNWRATVIPMLAVPVSLIGTLAAMLLFGFSINTLTLFGMRDRHTCGWKCSTKSPPSIALRSACSTRNRFDAAISSSGS